MRIALITDIYGVNSGVLGIATRIREFGAEVYLVSPYVKNNLEFSSEKQAYAAFVDLCGHENYSNLVLDTIEHHGCNIVIGASAGASAAWLACSRLAENEIDHLLFFYPTRIRKYLHFAPNVPTTIIFPIAEELFSVESLASDLSEKEQVHCIKTIFKHGFLNPSSMNFNCEGYTLFFEDDELLSLLSVPARYREKLKTMHDGFSPI